MLKSKTSRRHFLANAAQCVALSVGGVATTRSLAAQSMMQVPPDSAWGKEMRILEKNGLREKERVVQQQDSQIQARCPKGGAQRLSLSRLRAWEDLGYGMFIHFGMATYFGLESWKGDAPASTYNPDKLDVDQWVQIARDAGMKYAVLTTKHKSGFCIWPTRYTKYNVMNSGNKTDVVEAFILACNRRGVLPGLYYGSRDSHNGPPLGCKMPPPHSPSKVEYTTSLYQDFVRSQIDELLTQYGPVAEFWLDAPVVLGQGYRTYIYEHIASLQPERCVIMLNHGWPSDLMSYERAMPMASSLTNWVDVKGNCYYMPGEVDIPIGKNWFYVEGDKPKPDQELLNLYLETRKRGANLLLDVPPNEHGLISDEYRDALMRLRRNAKL